MRRTIPVAFIYIISSFAINSRSYPLPDKEIYAKKHLEVFAYDLIVTIGDRDDVGDRALQDAA